MEPVSLTAGAIATLVLTKAIEKTGEKLGEKVLEKGGDLMQLLKRKSPNTANAIELSQQQPLDYGKAVLELEAATHDSEVAKAVEELDAEVKADSKLAQAVEALANALKSQPPTVHNFGKIAEEIKEIKAFFQGGTFTGDFNF